MSSEPQTTILSSVGVLVAATALSISAPLPWLVVPGQVHARSYPLTHLGEMDLVAALGVAVVVVGALRALRGKPGGLDLAGSAGVGLLAAVALFVGVTKVLGVASPLLSLDGSVKGSYDTGPGAWLGLTAAAGVVAAAARDGRGGVGRVATQLRAHPTAVPAVLLACSALALIVLRETAWFTASIASQWVGFYGSTLPWIAPVNLAGIVLLLLAVGLIAYQRAIAGAMLAACAAWLVAMSGSIGLISSALVFPVVAARPHAALAPYAVIGIGVLAAGVAAALLAHHEQKEEL